MRSRSAGLLRATLRQSFVPSKLTGHPFPSSLQSSDDQLSFYFQDTLSSCSVYRVFGRGLASKSNTTVSKWKKYRGDVSGKLTERNDVAKDRSEEGNELHGIEGNIKRQRSRKGKDTALEEILGIGNEKGLKTAGRKRAGNSHSEEELKIQGRSEKRSKEIEVENAGQRSTKAQAVGKTKKENAFGVDGQSKSQSTLTDNTDLKDANEQIQLNGTAGKEIEEAALSGRSFVVEWTAGKKKKVKKMLVEDLSTMPVEELKVSEGVLSEGKPTKKSKKKVSASEKIVKPALVSDEVHHFSQVSKQNGKANESSPVEITFITQNSTISNLHNVSADFELLSLSSPGPLPHIETSLKAMKSSENSLGLSSSDPGGVISDPESFENRPELMAVVAVKDSIPLNNSSNNGFLENATTVLRTDSISQADNEKHLGGYQVAKLKDLDSNPEVGKLDSKLDFIVENGKTAKLMLENNSEPVRDSKDVTKYSSAIAVLERTLKILRNEDADVLKTSDTMSNSGESMSIETRKERWKSLYREKVERTLLKKGHIASATMETENCERQSFEGNMETGDYCSVHVSNIPKDEIELQSRHLGSISNDLSNEETKDELQSDDLWIQDLDDANKSMGTSSNETDHAASLNNHTNMVHGIEAKATMSCCLSGTESTVVSVNTDADGDYSDLDTDLNVTSILSNDSDTRVETETSTVDSFEEIGKREVEGEREAAAVAKDSPSDNFISDSDYSDADMDSEAATQAISLLRALDEPDDAEGTIRPEHQHSLRVGIVGAPNAGKSALMNYLVGTKVSAVSRKTNTTRGEILGVLTEGETQLLFYDTPGLTLDLKGQPLRQDAKSRVQNAWMIADHCEVLLVLVDAHRQIERPDSRVRRLISKLGVEERASQKRILCLNKVDLVKQKKSLVPVAQELGNLHGFDQVFMISGLKGGGIKDLKEYLVDQAVLRPWEEQPGTVTDMSPVMMAKEIVWEHILNNLHEELPYELRHEHISWKVLNDGSIRIEQQILVPTESHKKIVVGKHGVMIRRIGMSAHNELNARLGRTVHLFLDVKIYRAGSYISDLQQEFA